MDKRIIFFTGLKGGVGRSVLSEAYAAYLVSKGLPVTVIDADANNTATVISRRRKCTGAPSYTIVPLDCSKANSIETVRDFFEGSVDTIYIVDCRFNHDYKNLLYLYQFADMIVLPVQYHKLCTSSTLTFMEYLKRKGIYAPIYLLPNMCNNINNSQSEDGQQSQILGQWGEFLPDIPGNVKFTRFGCFDSYSKKMKALTGKTFDALTEKLELSPTLRREIIFEIEQYKDFESAIDRK